jgi:hypothetical protein
VVSEIGSSSSVDRLDFVLNIQDLDINSIISNVAQQAIVLFSDVDPDRLKKMGSYLIEQLETVQSFDRLYVAHSHKDISAVKEILLGMYAEKESALRNSMFQIFFDLVSENFEMVQFMVQEFPDLVQLDLETAEYSIEAFIQEGNEDAALWILANLEEGTDFRDAADDLLFWSLRDSAKEMPRLAAALEAIVEAI